MTVRRVLPESQSVPAVKLMAGLFVHALSNDLGPGKVISIDPPEVTIEYFDSIGQGGATRLALPIEAAKPVRIKPQTRCYWQARGEWRVGRVIGFQDGMYIVRSPNLVDEEVAEADLLVRWHRDLGDPTDVLIVRGHESAYFHNCRQPFVSASIAQRAACRGLTAILSSTIQFYEHQVQIARRILTDPVKRYVLADEVGLGKTIEAGLVVRQYLIEEPEGYVLVLSPEALRAQWVKELRDKFLIDDFEDARVKVMSHGEWQRWARYGMPGMMVIDEAHHLSDPASATPLGQDGFRELVRLARGTGRLLLLSATPLLHNEASFLGMLHLVDPDLHQLDGLDTFRSLVENRQELGRLFYTLRPNTPSVLLEEKILRLREMFPADQRLLERLDSAQNAIEADQGLVLEQTISSIRVHISEAYRLHRRLLRTRRTEEILDTYPVRGRKAPQSLLDEDPRRQTVAEWLEAFREQLILEASGRAGLEPLERGVARQAFWLFFEWSGSDLSQLQALLHAALALVPLSHLAPDLGTADAHALRTICDRPNLRALLSQLLEDLKETVGGRSAGVVRYMRRLPKVSRTVVFSGFHLVAVEISRSLEEVGGASSVARQLNNMGAEQLATELERFESDPFCRFLVCDSVAEEGRNLQHADLLIHADLHANPNRLEQRLGRVDRYSARRPVDSVVVQDDPTLRPGFHSGWLTCLTDGFNVFDASIASMQYAVEAVMEEIRERALEGGAPALAQCEGMVRDRLAAETQAIAEQDALEGIEAIDSDTALFADLDELENDWRTLKRATEDWASDARGNLRFDKVEDDRNREIVSFGFNPQGREPTLNSMPLVAWDVLAERFASATRHRGSFHRETGLANPGTRVFRLGEPFMDALESFTRSDDRGRAFAIWRSRALWSGNPDMVAIRFDYLAQGDTQPLVAAMESEGATVGHARSVARGRIDGCFRPMVKTLWLDADLERIADPMLEGLLQDPYDPGNEDIHLSARRHWILDEVVGRDRWEPLIREARAESERMLARDLDLVLIAREAQERATRIATTGLEQMRIRAHAMRAQHRVVGDQVDLAHETNLAEALIEGAGRPVVTLDSVGVVVLSSRRPSGPGFGQMEDEDD